MKSKLINSTAEFYHVMYALQVDSKGFCVAHEELVESANASAANDRTDLHVHPLGRER
jgi:hypothetical protein